MTDNEIIKALKLCTSEHMGCEDGCPYATKKLTYSQCKLELSKNIIDLINRQKAEISELTAEIERLQSVLKQTEKDFNKVYKMNFSYAKQIKQSKSEAYREFAKYLTKHIKDELEQCGNPNHDTQPIAYGTVLGLKSALSFVEIAPIILESDVPDKTATSVSLIDGHIEE